MANFLLLTSPVHFSPIDWFLIGIACLASLVPMIGIFIEKWATKDWYSNVRQYCESGFEYLIVTTIVVTLCSCKSDWGIKYIPQSKVFGTKHTEGFYGTHSKGYNSLMVKVDKKWEVVWRGVGGWPLIAWDNAVIFVSVTSESGAYSCLCHVKGFGTADILKEITTYRLLALGERKSKDMLEGRMSWRLDGDEIVWSAPADGDAPSSPGIEIRIKVKRIEEMASNVIAKKKRSSFMGNEFFE